MIMGMYALIFGFISVGLLLWFVSGSFVNELSPTMIERIDTLGTISIAIGLVSLALVFFGILRRG